jgi:aspartokinase
MNEHKPFSQELSAPDDGRTNASETQFERPRGIDNIEVVRGYARAEVSDLSEPLIDSRIDVLKALEDVSLNFVKFTQTGLSFVCKADFADKAEAALQAAGFKFDIQRDRCIVTAHAVNMRDDAGLIAKVISAAIASGANTDQFGDNHDRVMIACDNDSAERISKHLEELIEEATV